MDAFQIPDVLTQVVGWIEGGSTGHSVFLTNVNSVMEARRDPAYRELLNAADLSVPDGMPLVWLGCLQGHALPRRVYGPELLAEFCRQTEQKRYSHFFYGGLPGVAEAMADKLVRRYPSLRIAGTYSPPFRSLTSEEDAQIVGMINRVAPDVLWVGLGCPKQERWISQHCDRLQVPVMVGIGQAFDIYAGRMHQAPVWMQEHGLEWLFRFFQEPRRLWRRYLLYNTQFVLAVVQEFLKSRRVD